MVIKNTHWEDWISLTLIEIPEVKYQITFWWYANSDTKQKISQKKNGMFVFATELKRQVEPPLFQRVNNNQSLYTDYIIQDKFGN